MPVKPLNGSTIAHNMTVQVTFLDAVADICIFVDSMAPVRMESAFFTNLWDVAEWVDVVWPSIEGEPADGAVAASRRCAGLEVASSAHA